MASLTSVGNGIYVYFPKKLSEYLSVCLGVLKESNSQRKVAVKKTTYDITTPTKSQLDRLISLRENRNVVQYFRYVVAPNCDLYVAMELCRNTEFHDFIHPRKKSSKLPPGLSKENRRKILVHLALGLSHVHNNDMTFLTLKPKCILLSKNGKSIKITGFGLTKLVEKSSTSNSDRVQEWGSPEQYRRKNKTTKSDIFSAGLIFHYVESDGKHPFEGEKKNILDGRQTLDLSEHTYPLIAENIIKRMISADPDDRPNADDILLHPLLWEEDVKRECSDLLHEVWIKLPSNEKEKIVLDYPKTSLLNSAIDGDDELKKRDAMLLLYCALVSEDSTDTNKSFWEEAAKKNGVDLKSVLKKFTKPVEYSELDSSEFEQNEEHDNFDLTDLREAIAEADRHRTRENVGDDLEIRDQPLRLASPSVFRARIKSSVVEEARIVKMVDITANPDIGEVFKAFKALEGPGIVTITRIQAEGRIIMEECSQKTIEGLVESEDLSLEDKKNASKQILSALNELHKANIVHRNISPRKFCMSKQGTKVQMLPSREMRISSEEKLRHADLKSTAKVLCVLVCCNGNAPIDKHWSAFKDADNMYKLCETSPCFDHVVFRDLIDQLWNGRPDAAENLCHPFFWPFERRLIFWSDFSDECEALKPKSMKKERERKFDNLAPADWIGLLKLEDDEKMKWFPDDSNGYIYDKANATNSNYKKNPSVGSLVRLIRNIYHHWRDDIDTKYNGTEEQSLFQGHGDVWKFFDRRFGKLFLGTYSIAREEDRSKSRFKNYFPTRAKD